MNVSLSSFSLSCCRELFRRGPLASGPELGPMGSRSPSQVPATVSAQPPEVSSERPAAGVPPPEAAPRPPRPDQPRPPTSRHLVAVGHKGMRRTVVVELFLHNTSRIPISEASGDVLMQHGAHIHASRIAMGLCFPMFLRPSCVENRIRIEIIHQHKKSM